MDAHADEQDPLDDEDLAVFVTSSISVRPEATTLRRYVASLAHPTYLDDDEGEGPIPVGELATCEASMVSLKYGLTEAFLDADAEHADLTAVMEELLALERDQLLTRIFPSLEAVLIVDFLTVPEELRGHQYGVRLVRGLAKYFDFVPGSVLLVGYPVPDGADEMDPFTLRARRTALEGLCKGAGMSIFGHSGAWYTTLAALREVEL